MISRIATAALAVAGSLSLAVAETALQAAAVDPFALNTTSWMVSYQFLDDSCVTEPITGSAQPMGKCYVARGESYASYLYVCNNEQGAGMLTYSGSNCEPDTFIEYAETVPVTALDQCIDKYTVDVPHIVNIFEEVVDGQIFQCTNDNIGHGLLNQPADAIYLDKCKNALRVVGYFRTTECLGVDASTSLSVTCSKRNGFESRYYRFDGTCDDDTYFSTGDVNKCEGINQGFDTAHWEYMTCDGSTLPDGDAAFTTAAGFGWVMVSAMALLTLFRSM